MRPAAEEELYSLEDVRRTVDALPQVQELGIKLLEVRRGLCSARIDPSPRLAGNLDTGALHGGVVTTLLDTLGGAASFSVVRKEQTVATLDLRIDYLRTSEPGRAIFGRVECYRLSRSVAFARGIAYCDPEEPLAHCTATFMIGSVGLSLS